MIPIEDTYPYLMDISTYESYKKKYGDTRQRYTVQELKNLVDTLNNHAIEMPHIHSFEIYGNGIRYDATYHPGCDLLLGMPLEDMPCFLNENISFRLTAMWRLKLGR